MKRMASWRKESSSSFKTITYIQTTSTLREEKHQHRALIPDSLFKGLFWYLELTFCPFPESGTTLLHIKFKSVFTMTLTALSSLKHSSYSLSVFAPDLLTILQILNSCLTSSLKNRKKLSSGEKSTATMKWCSREGFSQDFWWNKMKLMWTTGAMAAKWSVSFKKQSITSSSKWREMQTVIKIWGKIMGKDGEVRQTLLAAIVKTTWKEWKKYSHVTTKAF